jgi:hypothetical protein
MAIIYFYVMYPIMYMDLGVFTLYIQVHIYIYRFHVYMFYNFHTFNKFFGELSTI